MRYLLLLSLFIVSCTNKPLRSDLPTEDLFPDGVYQQNIFISFVIEKVAKSFSISGVLKKNKNQYTIYSYNGFGVTLFKLQDSGEGPPIFKTSISEIEENKDFFLKMYPQIKKILKLNKRTYQSQLLELGDQINGQIFLHFEPGSEIPKKILIQGQDKYDVTIENLKFSLDTSHH